MQISKFAILFALMVLSNALLSCSQDEQSGDERHDGMVTGTSIGEETTLEIGQAIPDFELPVLDADPSSPETSTTKSLADFKGKVIYLDFWATWCAPCRESMPLVNKMWLELRDQGLEVIAINFDREAVMAKHFLKDYGIEYLNLYGGDPQFMERYKIPGLPTAFILDRQGILRHIHLGFVNQDMAFLEQTVKSLVAPKDISKKDSSPKQ